MGFVYLVPSYMFNSYCFHLFSSVCLLLTRTIVLVTKFLYWILMTVCTLYGYDALTVSMYAMLLVCLRKNGFPFTLHIPGYS